MTTRSPQTRKPRLVHVATVPVTHWAFLRGQNQFMAEQGFEIHAVSSPNGWLTRLAARDPVETHAVAMTRRITPLKDAVSLFRLFLLFRRIRPDIVQVGTPKAALLGALAAWAARVPARIFLVRGLSSENSHAWRKRLLCWLERLTARLCHVAICDSPSLLEYARREGILGPQEGKVLVHGMSNGVDARRFDPDAVAPANLAGFGVPPQGAKDDRLVIGYVGRITRAKGIEDLAAAWTEIREEYPHAILLFVGPHEKEDSISPATRVALDTDPRVVLTGIQDDVAPFYRAMQVLVLPSHREGFPNAPMEAAAMGLPVITTRVCGSMDAVVDGITGAVVPARDPRALAEALRSYLRDPDLRAKHGAAGRRRVLADFRPEAIWRALYREYERLLRENSLPLPVPGQRAPQPILRPAERRAAA